MPDSPSDQRPHFQIATHMHGVTKIVITPITGDYGSSTKLCLGRNFEFFVDLSGLKHSTKYTAPEFRFTVFGNDVQWIIPDDVFEAELRRRGEAAAAKINSATSMTTLTNVRCLACGASLSPQIPSHLFTEKNSVNTNPAIYHRCHCGQDNLVWGKP